MSEAKQRGILTFIESVGRNIAGKVKEVIETERAEVAREEARLKREHDATSTTVAPVPPWEDLGEGVDDDTRKKVAAMVLSLTKSRRSFLGAPPEDDTTFLFELDVALPSARAALAADPRLAAAREWLVPRRVHEKVFWRNWFWRVSVIKQSFGILWPTPGVSLPAGARLPKASTATSAEDDTEAWEAELRAALVDYEASKGHHQQQQQKTTPVPVPSFASVLAVAPAPVPAAPAQPAPVQTIPVAATAADSSTTGTTTPAASSWEKEVEAELQGAKP